MADQRRGTRRDGTNPRALGVNERATARNKWALRTWKRQQKGGSTTTPKTQ
jgi:hypothetical protein